MCLMPSAFAIGTAITRTHAVEIVAHQQRLARAREVVHLVGRVALARISAFEMGDEARPLGREILVVAHVRLPSVDQGAVVLPRRRKTTKCESEKLTRKL